MGLQAHSKGFIVLVIIIINIILKSHAKPM